MALDVATARETIALRRARVRAPRRIVFCWIDAYDMSSAAAPESQRTPQRTRPSPLVGREAELEALDALLEKRWHVTIVGTAGVGKSRLAHEVLRRRGGPFVACDLTQAIDADDVLNALARALAIEPGEGGAVKRVASVLAAKGRFCVLLDGVDRLSATAWDKTVSRFLGACPELHVVATARARLRVEGEAAFPLGPLDVTPRGDDCSLAELFFLGLAEGVLGRDLRENGHVPDHVRALVRVLDGLPLALEIAASVLNVLSPYEFLKRGALLLDAPSPGKSWGGGSLRAAFEVSWERLPEGARAALQAVSVFVGGFDLTAAEAVVGASALDHLSLLCEASLVASSAEGGITRFRMFECVRQFASDRETSSLVVARARERHAAYFGGQGAAWARRGESRERLRALAWLTTEESNLVAVAERTVEREAPPSEVCVGHAAGALSGLAWLWLGRGPLEPHTRLLDRATSLLATDVCRASVAAPTFLLMVAISWRHRGDLDRASRILDDALDRARQVAQPYLEARCLLERARIARLRGDRDTVARSIDEAASLTAPSDDDLIRLHVTLSRRLIASLDEPALLEASRLARRVGDPLATAHVELAYATFCFAMGRAREAIEHARRVDEEAEKLRQNTWKALAALVAGNALAEQGHVDAARAMFETTLRLGLANAHRRSEAEARANIALLDFEAGRIAAAVEGLTVATNLFSRRDPTRLYFLAALAGVEASQPARAEEAAERFHSARNEASRVAPALVVEIDRFGEMFQLRCDAKLARVRELRPTTTAALSASRVAHRVRQSVRARLARDALVVARDAAWFRPPGREIVSLAARPVLGALVRELLRARRESPDGFVAREDLVRAIWPAERSSRSSMGNRLSVAISTLRSLGLDALVSTQQGLALDPSVAIDDTP